MKFHTFSIFLVFSSSVLVADEKKPSKQEALNQHAAGAEKVAEEQDELSATVQQLGMEQTIPEVIKLLSEVEEIMDETTDYLSEPDTGGRTIAAQTEIIEKIHQAAKKKQQQQPSAGGEAGSAMMDMMERMMGKGEGQGKGQGKGKGEGQGEGEGEGGNKGGQGSGGESNSGNDSFGGPHAGKSEERRVPKAAGKTGKNLPDEFQAVLDAYNRGMEGLEK